MTGEQKGLRLAAGVTVGFGLMMALASHPATNGPAMLLADGLVWPFDAGQTGQAAETRLLAAISGGVLAGWGAMMWMLAGAPFARDPDGMRGVIRSAILIWFAVDSLGSLAASVPLNVAGNIVFAALFLLPMLPGRRQAQA